MESLNLEQYQPYILILMGLISIAISFFYRSNTKTLEKEGERCEGIIFKLDYNKEFGSTSTNSTVKDKITVRFVTKTKEWITEDLNIDFMITYSGQYKEGEKVSVIYNPENPKEFLLETKQSQTKGRQLFFFAGIVFAAFGIYKLLKN